MFFTPIILWVQNIIIVFPQWSSISLHFLLFFGEKVAKSRCSNATRALVQRKPHPSKYFLSEYKQIEYVHKYSNNNYKILPLSIYSSKGEMPSKKNLGFIRGMIIYYLIKIPSMDRIIHGKGGRCWG